MDFVDRHRRVERVDAVARWPRPRQLRAVDHDRGGERAASRLPKPTGSDFSSSCAGASDDLVFVFVAGAGAGHEDFPVAVAAHAHGMAAAVPAIEVADDADAPRVRRPDHEGDAVHAVHLHRMRAELVVERAGGCLRRADRDRTRRAPAESGKGPPARPRCRRSGRAAGSARDRRRGPANRPAGVDALELAFAAVARSRTPGWHRAERRARRCGRPRYAGRDNGTGRHVRPAMISRAPGRELAHCDHPALCENAPRAVERDMRSRPAGWSARIRSRRTPSRAGRDRAGAAPDRSSAGQSAVSASASR